MWENYEIYVCNTVKEYKSYTQRVLNIPNKIVRPEVQPRNWVGFFNMHNATFAILA